MSSWWAEKIREEMPAPPAPPMAATVAPGSWWQQAPEARAGVLGAPAALPTAAPGGDAGADYRPAEARSTTATDRCPRCGSDEYASIVIDTSFGGPGGSVKRCFDCRYPGMDASGDIIKGKGIRADGGDAVRHNVRQQGNPRNGSWGGSVTWDAAPLIV